MLDNKDHIILSKQRQGAEYANHHSDLRHAGAPVGACRNAAQQNCMPPTTIP